MLICRIFKSNGQYTFLNRDKNIFINFDLSELFYMYNYPIGKEEFLSEKELQIVIIDQNPDSMTIGIQKKLDSINWYEEQLYKIIIHNFSNIITAVNNNSYLLSQYMDDIQSNNNKICDTVDKINSLCKISLDFSKNFFIYKHNPHKFYISTFSLSLLIKEVFDLLEFKLKNMNISFIKKTQENIPKIIYNKNSLFQIITSVILNAIESFSNINEKSKDRLIIVSISFRSNNNFKIQITDNGAGISSDNLKKIFEEGFTTKAKGHGMGLYFAKKILSKNKDYIDISSQEYQGTIVTINIKNLEL